MGLLHSPTSLFASRSGTVARAGGGGGLTSSYSRSPIAVVTHTWIERWPKKWNGTINSRQGAGLALLKLHHKGLLAHGSRVVSDGSRQGFGTNKSPRSAGASPRTSASQIDPIVYSRLLAS